MEHLKIFNLLNESSNSEKVYNIANFYRHVFRTGSKTPFEDIVRIIRKFSLNKRVRFTILHPREEEKLKIPYSTNGYVKEVKLEFDYDGRCAYCVFTFNDGRTHEEALNDYDRYMIVETGAERKITEEDPFGEEEWDDDLSKYKNW
jgi:hypothetical protein